MDNESIIRQLAELAEIKYATQFPSKSSIVDETSGWLCSSIHYQLSGPENGETPSKSASNRQNGQWRSHLVM